MKEKKRVSLRHKTLLGIVIFAVALVIAISVPVSMGFYYLKMNDYTDAAFDYSRMAAEIIDGDRIAGYLESGEKDAYYNAILKFLNATQKETDLKYYYVFVPYEDDLVYVWDAENNEGACELGEHEEYMEGGKEAVEKIYRQDPPEQVKMTKDDKYGYIASAFTPIFNSNGDPVAVVGVDLSVPGIAAILRQFIFIIIFIIVLVSAVMMLVSYIILQKNLLDPLGLLTESAGKMVDNLERDGVMSIDIHTNDEIETLADTFVQMDTDLHNYVRQLETVTAEKERIGAELNIATKIQASMLPRIFPPFPEREEFDLFASMNPAKEVGGDFYDFFMIGENKLGLVIADVSGKGVPAALFMVIAKVLIKNFTLQGMSPSEVLERVNERLCSDNDAGMFVTVWLAILDIETGDGLAANAGHEHPAVWREKEGTFELVKYKHSPAVAVMEGMMFREHDFHLDPGDMVFVYTDGVTEATNADEQLFGEERLVLTLNRCGGSEAGAVISAVKCAIDEFVGDADQFDDITMLSMKYRGPKKA